MVSVRQDEIEARFYDVFLRLDTYVHQPGNEACQLDYIHKSFVEAAVVDIDGPNERISLEQADGNEVHISFKDVAIIDEMISKNGNRTFHGSSAMPQNESNQIDPPKRAEMLLHFGLPKCDRECMIGDLEEEYRRVILPKYGAGVAARWYWWQAVRSVVSATVGRVRVWLSFGGLARAAGWIVEKFGL